VAEAAKPLETAESTDDQTTGKRSAEPAQPEDAADVKKAKTDDEVYAYVFTISQGIDIVTV
jgi:hypothetical protein